MRKKRKRYFKGYTLEDGLIWTETQETVVRHTLFGRIEQPPIVFCSRQEHARMKIVQLAIKVE